MLSGSDGLGIQFENIHAAKNIGTIALCIILFQGLDTVSRGSIVAQGVILATLVFFSQPHHGNCHLVDFWLA